MKKSGLAILAMIGIAWLATKAIPQPKPSSPPFQVFVNPPSILAAASLQLRNTGTVPLSVHDIRVNSRPDCTLIPQLWLIQAQNSKSNTAALANMDDKTKHKVWLSYEEYSGISNLMNGTNNHQLEDDLKANSVSLSPPMLPVGQVMTRTISCPGTIVRLEVSTDQGDWTFNTAQ
jgi:hypothetical protein